MSMNFQIELTPDDNGTFLVTCPALPEVSTFGVGEADCVDHARDAIEEAWPLAFREAPTCRPWTRRGSVRRVRCPSACLH
jgi:predicted RNase H-like HicB family nuclease